MYKWLLFDLDNTLLDFSLAEKQALCTLFEQQNLPYSEQIFGQYKAINHVIWAAFERGELTPNEIKWLRFQRLFEALDIDHDAKAFGAAYTTQLGLYADFMPGAEPLVHQLAPLFKLGLITNGLSKVQNARLHRSMLNRFFDPILISEEVGAKKPEQKIFEIAFQRMGHPPKGEVLIIGDSLSSDIRGGVDFGIDTCWFNPRRLPKPADVNVTYQISELAQLPTLLKVG